jgi:hypothetical protein
MTCHPSNRAGARIKPSFTFSPSNAASNLIDGVVQDPRISPDLQIAILAIIDETGSTTIGDLTDRLAPRPEVGGAVLALVAAGIVTLALTHGVLDASTLVVRAPVPASATPPEAATDQAPIAVPADDRAADNQAGIGVIPTSALAPRIVTAPWTQRRGLGKLAEMGGFGVYILLSRACAYVGYASNLAARIAQGSQPIDNVETVIAITDTGNGLDETDARTLERIVWSRLAATGEYQLVNSAPDGAGIDLERYTELELFAAQAAIALRHEDLLFYAHDARKIIAGPLLEPGHQSKRRNDRLPETGILSLEFGGLIAHATRQSDDRWILLAGSEVRIETVASANTTVRYRRSAWLHTGVLALDPDGKCYRLMRDIVFSSGSAAAQFCAGSKGRTLSAWKPIDPDGGFDPDTPALIAA